MEDKKEVVQFDATLGGDEQLPYDVHILKFAAARSKEISAMTECILNPCHNKLIFQSLPVHMRRRVMSHNSKRLPRRLRLAHESQLKRSGLPLPQKRPSRKHRRRPGNLVEEYKRRQKQSLWLETHIWHAKRFHMTKLWGWKLPEAPCDKAFRACYRAGSKHCLLQDLSYYPSIQLSGTVEELFEGFKRITSSNCGLGLTSKAYLSSKREGAAFIFDIDKYPHECVGKVSFFWKPTEKNCKYRTIWMFMHPSCYDAIIHVLCSIFTLSNERIESLYAETKFDGSKRKPSETIEISAKRLKLDENKELSIDSIEIDQHVFTSKSSVRMVEFKNMMNRFRLTGPLSQAILNKALAPLCSNFGPPNSISKANLKYNWFKYFYKDNSNKKNHQIQSCFWSKMKNVKSPAELSCKMIISLNVKDPRINLPNRRIKAISDENETLKATDLAIIPDGISSSALWDINILKDLAKQKIPTLQINKLRENSNLVPGSPCNWFYEIPGIPILLIQRPGSQVSEYKRIGYNSGWDILIPDGYGMPFWMAFILRGARAGGLRESTKLAFESGQTDYHPDTLASQNEDNRLYEILKTKYFCLPPNKRVNFAKLSINSPFLCRWNILFNDWKNKTTEEESLYVLRDKAILSNLQLMVKNNKIISEFDWSTNCLVPVKLLTRGKGMISKYTIICLPNSNDHLSNKSSQLVEPLKKDVNQRKRQEMRSTHKKTLAKLRRKTVRTKKIKLKNAEKCVTFPKQDNGAMINDYLSQMRELWLPSNIDNVRYQCNREVMGYVTHGDFSFTEAQSAGVGYVTLPSIKLLLQNSYKKCYVLTRGTLTRQYRFASLNIICDSQ